MMIVCERHGQQPGVLASPDLAELAEQGRALVPHRTIRHEYKGDEQARMIVSEEFASAENVPESRTLPLPDDYPEWYLKLVPVCGKCLP
jgi:hypothetical protein